MGSGSGHLAHDLGDAGIDQVIFSMANTTDPKAYPLVAEVVRQVA